MARVKRGEDWRASDQAVMKRLVAHFGSNRAVARLVDAPDSTISNIASGTRPIPRNTETGRKILALASKVFGDAEPRADERANARDAATFREMLHEPAQPLLKPMHEGDPFRRAVEGVSQLYDETRGQGVRWTLLEMLLAYLNWLPVPPAESPTAAPESQPPQREDIGGGDGEPSANTG
jgi:hypothetical protein